MSVCTIRYLAALGVFAVTAWSQAGSATEPIDRRDLRCLVVGLEMSQMDKPDTKSAGQLLTIYYLGRLQPHNAKSDLEEPLLKELSSWTAADFSSEAVRCGTELKQVGEDLTALGQRLKRRGAQMEEQSKEGSTGVESKPDNEQAPK